MRFPNRGAVRKFFEAVEPAIYYKFRRLIDQKNSVRTSRFQNCVVHFAPTQNCEKIQIRGSIFNENFIEIVTYCA
jgi:hypothetical protein